VTEIRSDKGFLAETGDNDPLRTEQGNKSPFDNISPCGSV